jgi:predicted O-methyltransferase YrrM
VRVSPLPQRLRSLTPTGLRDDPRLRAVAVGAGLIPPRTMHSSGEAALLERLAAGRRRVVEVGVYEGSSAVVLCRVLGPEAELHLIDPFGHHADALRPGWGATEAATKRVVARAARRSGPRVTWHVAFSADVARGWAGGPVDLVFVDGDHSEAGAAADWEGWAPHVGAGGVVVFHDARAGRPGGVGLPGPTAVVDGRVRGAAGWEVAEEVDGMVAVRRTAG